MTRFQTIFMAILVFLGVGGALIFAMSKSGSGEAVPEVVMWGTMRSSLVGNFLSSIDNSTRDIFKVRYVEKAAASLESELIAALARGGGPDMILMPQDFILKQYDKFFVIPYSSYSERTFKDSFIQEGELYLSPEGAIGLPFSIDPLVMYWNRDIFANEGIALPPVSWTEFFTLAPKIIKKNDADQITQSLVAFGETRNVLHAKDILALLAIQAGTPIVARDDRGSFVSVLEGGSGGLVPAEQALSYFVEFSNPNKPSYSWNRALPTDRNSFVAGRLAVYFGYASELQGLRASNPNLNFDVAAIPQVSTLSRKTAFGAMNAIAILKSSRNASAAFVAATSLTGADLQAQWVEFSGLAPIRRDMLAAVPADAYKAVFYQSALIAKAWLDPNSAATDDVFMRMVENVTSGKMRVSESVRDASQEIDSLIRTNI